jgi:hypothetical protein
MSKEEKKAEPKAYVPAHIANRLVKVKKPKKKDWMAFALKYPKHMEVQEVTPWGKGDLAEFEKMPDGTFHVSVLGQSDDRFQGVTLTPEQFAAFKQWVMEN